RRAGAARLTAGSKSSSELLIHGVPEVQDGEQVPDPPGPERAGRRRLASGTRSRASGSEEEASRKWGSKARPKAGRAARRPALPATSPLAIVAARALVTASVRAVDHGIGRSSNTPVVRASPRSFNNDMVTRSAALEGRICRRSLDAGAPPASRASAQVVSRWRTA